MFTDRLARTIAAAGAAALAVGALAGCSGSSDSTSEASEENPYGLIEPGTVRVASVGDIKPYAYTDADGEFTGFDVELFTEVADRAGLGDVEFVGQDFAAVLPGVANGQFDVGVAAIGITEERQETVDFSDGYLVGYLTVLTTEDSGIEGVEDLAGKRLGVVQGSLQEKHAVENFTEADIVRFNDNNSGVSGMNSGSIDAMFLDYEAAQDYIDQYDDHTSAADIPSFDAPAGFAVAPDNDALREELNEALESTMEDGTWKELYQTWFPESPVPDRYLPSDEQTETPSDDGETDQ